MNPSSTPIADGVPNRAITCSCRFQKLLSQRMGRKGQYSSSETPTERSQLRLLQSLTPHNLHRYLSQSESDRRTVLYLAYGSNLSNETFRGKRGIKPISQINVQVPSLRLTFDLPGIPYAEPCFANTARRDPRNDPPSKSAPEDASEKTPLLPSSTENKADYHKDRWHKGLIGVVYELTPTDYAHVIATEGGGSSYQDILIDCHAFASPDPKAPVPINPTLPAFKAHTLFAPATPTGKQPPKNGGHFQRPDTSYAQASARYLKLITDGAAELQLPYEYQDYLQQLRPYTITSNQQRIGQFIFVGIWGPLIMFVFAMAKMFENENGQAPEWLKQLSGAIFMAVWGSYDGFFKSTFGDGERTIEDGGNDSGGDEEPIPLNGQPLLRNWRSDRRRADSEMEEKAGRLSV